MESVMEPCELEFIGENEMIGIIPNFTLDSAIHLISGSIGPFRAGLPVHGKFFTVSNKSQEMLYLHSKQQMTFHKSLWFIFRNLISLNF